jgi:membrane protease subunit HflC
VTVLVAEATSKAEQTRGEGDALRNRIFAAAYSKDPDFFSFYRTMQAYEAGLKPSDTRMLLRPDSEFFRYFANRGTKDQAQASSATKTSPAATPSKSSGQPQSSVQPPPSTPKSGRSSSATSPQPAQ